MYLKRHGVRRGSKRYTYLRLVEAYRDELGHVRHRVLANLGREDELKASGQLDHLAAAFTRADPPRLGARREVGPLLLVRHFVERLGLVKLVDRHVPQRGRADLSTGEVVAALVANRLCAPAPLYDIAAWGAGAALHELLGVPGMLLNDDRLGRALEALAPVAEAVRGAAALAAIEAFGVDAARLHLDLTTLRVAGAYEGSALVRKGWGADRHVRRQVRMLQAVNREGIPLYVRPHPGDAAELTCIGLALERLAHLLGPGLLVCADSALGHLKNLCAAHRAKLHFIVPLRADTGFAERFLNEVGHQALHPLPYVSHRDRDRPAEQRPRYQGALRSFNVVDPDTKEGHRFRVVYVWSSEEAESVREARGRALLKAEKALTTLRRAYVRGAHTKQELESKLNSLLTPSLRDLFVIQIGSRAGKRILRWHRNAAALKTVAQTDGIYALATNLPGRISATRVLRLYKEQHRVEQRHRDAKQTLRVRPIFLHNDDRIVALTSIVGLALLVFGLIEMSVRRALGPQHALEQLLPEGRSAMPTGRSILAAFQGLEMTYTEDGPMLDRLTSTQRRILDLLKITPPWPELAAQTPAMCGKRG
jgi:transposase